MAIGHRGRAGVCVLITVVKVRRIETGHVTVQHPITEGRNVKEMTLKKENVLVVHV